jgi:2-keto-4-pentenoate hydratase/2-oxohepta-3-ene-1,7-dioic acid hydratase in catechol pathway
MRFVTYRARSLAPASPLLPGLVVGGDVLDLQAAARVLDLPLPRDPMEILRGGEAIADLLREVDARAADLDDCRVPAERVVLGPPVPQPGKIVCVGLNYRRHAAETGNPPPPEPILFGKYGNAIAGPGDEVAIGGLSRVDYEAELAFVIGRRAKNVAAERALAFVAGYLNANDVSEREMQMRSGQWLLGKTLDRFLPIGPYLVSADEVGDPGRLPVRGWLNGDLRQDSDTSDLIFSVEEIVAYVSRVMTLEPGDLICTGTPEGVILGLPEKVWIAPGDVYEIEIGPLGRLATRFVSELESNG